MTECKYDLFYIIYQCCFNVDKTTFIELRRFNVDEYQCCLNVEIWLKMKVEPTYVYQRCFWMLTKQRWNNFDRVTLIQCLWLNVVSTSILGWKRKLSERMFMGVEKTALKQLCQNLLYWGSLESGSVIKQN